MDLRSFVKTALLDIVTGVMGITRTSERASRH